MKKSYLFFSTFALAALLFNSCRNIFDYTDGSGYIIKKERNISKFNSLTLSGSGNVYLIQGADEKVVVETDDNIMSNVFTDLHGKVLELGTHGWNSPTKLNFYITVKNINAVSVSGSGQISSSAIKTDYMELNINGSGKIIIDNLVSSNLINEVSGSGEIQVNSGITDYTECDISGSGRIDLLRLTSNKCKISISGSGDCKINVVNDLRASISGSGNVYYHGNPQGIDLHSSGSGAFKKI
ncbi:MAG: DUF2807 domain-containing protein [Candidatus Kapabacteria bacterium]|nr:DUF2807 domain-containing protein [Candidatus Kapabacteria bacterium]